MDLVLFGNIIEIREPRGGDENGQVPPRKAKPPTVIEIREPRGGDENAKVGLTPHFLIY